VEQSAASGVIFGMMMLTMLFPLLLLLFLLVSQGFWVWMLVDCASNPRLVGNDKTVWILIVIFTNWIGALVYLFVARPKRFQTPPIVNPPATFASQNHPPILSDLATAQQASADGVDTQPVICPNCGKTSPYGRFLVNADNKGRCPECSAYVEFK